MLKNKQLAITQFGKNISKATTLQLQSLPSLGSDQVLIKHTFVGINAIYDRELYRGNIPYIAVDFPYVFGVEAVGVVMEVGSKVINLVKGQAVSTVKVGTAYQQYQIVGEDEAVKIPEATPEYLALNPTGVSAYLALKKVAELQAGETVVVSAAAGGLGHLVVQLAKQKGCHVVGICGSEEKSILLKNLKACNRIINYRSEDVTGILNKEYTNAIDVGFDSVGTSMFDAMLSNLAPLGRLVVSGLASEFARPQFEKITRSRVYETLYWKGASVRCFMNHLYKEEHGEVRKLLFKNYQDGKLKVVVDPTAFNGIEGIVDASNYLLEGRSCGKVVVAL